MQRFPSTQSNKSLQQAKSSEEKTSSKADDKTSTTVKQGDDTKKPADNTDHTTVSSSFCGCKKDKCDAFFDKLLCYLEKQSDIIAKCCANSRENKRDSCHEIKPKSSKDPCKDYSPNRRPIDPCKDDSPNRRPKDPCKDDSLEIIHSKEMKPKHTSPCKDDPEPTFHHRASAETQKSLKGRGKERSKDCPDDESDRKPSRFKSELDAGGGRQMTLGDKPCNIYVEVCSCQKEGRRAHPSRGSQKTLDADSEQYLFKQRSATPPRRQPSGKSNDYGIDCHGCEKKVCHFFKLAEEICQGYMKQCQEQDPNWAQSNHSGKRRNSRENFGNQVPSRPYQAQPWNEGSDENDRKPEKLPARGYDAYDRPYSMPIAIEIECQGTKEEFTVEPCQCVERRPDCSYGRGRPTAVPSRVESQGPKKSCLEVFEERYGKILRDLHTKLFPDPKQTPPPAYPPQDYPPQDYPPQGYPPQGYPPQGYPPQGYPTRGYPPPGYLPQGYPPPGYPNPYGDAAPQQPPPQQTPTQQPPPQQPPPQQPPPQQTPTQQPPPPPPKQETIQPPKESKQSEDDDSSEERKKRKKDKKEDKKKKKK